MRVYERRAFLPARFRERQGDPWVPLAAAQGCRIGFDTQSESQWNQGYSGWRGVKTWGYLMLASLAAAACCRALALP